MYDETPQRTFGGFGQDEDEDDRRMEEIRRRKQGQPAKVWTLDEVRMLMMGRGSADCDWGAPANTTIVYKIGIYGWRKRCLYVFILLIMVTVIVNLALTIWILKVMDFSVHGMGQLRVDDNGLKVEGDAEFLHGLYTSNVKSRAGAALTLESSRNITLNARSKEKKLTNRLILGNGKISSYAKMFEVRAPSGEVSFWADEDKVRLGASTLNIAGPEGANVEGSIQTPRVQALSQNLRLESPTRSLVVSAPEGVTVESASGPVDISSSGAPIKLRSHNQVIIEGKTIHLKSLALSEPHTVDSPFQEVYQLCLCKNDGKLFLSPAQGTCQATGAICD